MDGKKLRISEYKNLMKNRRQEVRRIWYGDSGTTYVEGLLSEYEISRFYYTWVAKNLEWDTQNLRTFHIKNNLNVFSLMEFPSHELGFFDFISFSKFQNMLFILFW